MEATHFEGKQEILHPEGGYGQPMKVDIHEYEEVTRNLSELEPKIVSYESTNEQKPVHSTSDSTIPPPPPAPPLLSTTHEKEEAGGGTGGSGVSLRSASKTLPCADEPTASIPYQTIDDIVNNLQHSIDLLVTAGKIDRNTSHNHNEKHSAEHSKESKTRGFFSLPWIKNRPMSETSKAPPIKDLPKEKATSLSSSSTKDVPSTVPSPKDPKVLIPITELEHDFVFIPSNKEEEKEKKILDKMEKRERALAKKVTSTESKLASLRTQVEKLEAELEIERQSVKDADAEILSKRYDLLLLKEKGDKERAERERIEKEHTEKEKSERERTEAERIRAMKEEVRGDLDEIGHAQSKEVGH